MGGLEGCRMMHSALAWGTEYFALRGKLQGNPCHDLNSGALFKAKVRINSNLVISNALVKDELPPWKLTFQALALRQSKWRRANARNVSFFKSFKVVIQPLSILWWNQTFVSLSHRRSSTVSLETRNSFSINSVYKYTYSYKKSKTKIGAFFHCNWKYFLSRPFTMDHSGFPSVSFSERG